MNKVVCDSSSLISLSDNCLLWLLPNFDAEFVVPMEVKREIVDRPMKAAKFEFKAVRLQQSLLSGAVQVIADKKVTAKGKEIVDLSNSLFRYGKHNVKIIHGGEAESLALMKKNGIQTLLVDERTTRLIIEDREALQKYIQHRTGFNLKLNHKVARRLEEELGGIKVIRSSELVAWAYEHGLMERFGDGKDLLHASLYGLKYSGCSISTEEIEDYVRMLA